jgi:hypothetical protein
MGVGHVIFNIFSILGFVFPFAAAVFTAYVVIIVLKGMRERNEYLRDIRDELRKRNDTSN